MNKKHSPLLILGISAAFSAALTHTAMASDISTLVGQVRDTTGPNVTLVIDTSGSMNSQIFIEGAVPFDPAVDYVGPFDVYEDFGIPKRLLYTLKPSASINYPDENDVNSNQWVNISNFVCLAGQSVLTNEGLYTGRFAQFRVDGDSAFWSFPSPAGTNGGEEALTECQADFGRHGDGSDLGNFPINFNPLPTPSTNLFPWSADETDPRIIDWNDTGANYTFFTPNYLNWIYERKQDELPVVLSRLEIVQGVAKELVETLQANTELTVDDLRLGLMRFSANGSGGMILTPTEKIATNGETLITQINELTASGSTPLAETMFEAYRYHAGEAPRFGLGTSPSLSSDDSFDDDGTYRSPIVGSCQKSFVILLTDGQPNADFQADLDIAALTSDCGADNCLDEMTNYMSTTDLIPNSDLEGEQTVDTFTIGFFADFPLLEDAATAEIDTDGDDIPDTPGYFLANNAAQLREAFTDIF
ncbi:MAG: hypothetical protein AB8G18_18005, partial [Gammaproteobacteria bacterium]